MCEAEFGSRMPRFVASRRQRAPIQGELVMPIGWLQTCPHPVADRAKEADIIALGIDADARTKRGGESADAGQLALEGRGSGRIENAKPNTHRKGTYGEHSSKKALSEPNARF